MRPQKYNILISTKETVIKFIVEKNPFYQYKKYKLICGFIIYIYKERLSNNTKYKISSFKICYVSL